MKDKQSLKPGNSAIPRAKTTMKIKILRLGHSARNTETPAGTTIAELLIAEDIGTSGYAFSVNGLGASGSTALAEGDVITLVPKVEGGSR